jgi:hypothetical protein
MVRQAKIEGHTDGSINSLAGESLYADVLF